MTDDIVTRLRAWTIAFTWDWSLPNDAADEIERLRTQLEQLFERIRQLENPNGDDCPPHGTPRPDLSLVHIADDIPLVF